MATILVTSRSFSSGSIDLVARAAAHGHTIVRGSSEHPLPELSADLAAADAWIAGTGPVTDAHLAAAPRLRIVARYGVGTEAVDVGAARSRGVIVTNTPGANSHAVADHALALILAALRNVTAGDRGVRAGDWGVTRGRELGAATVGIVGFGRIGQGVAARLTGFGARILAADPMVPAAVAADRGADLVPLSELLATADIVTLHAPGGTRLIDATSLEAVPAGTVIVNTARPDLVDEAAVAAALRSGKLGAYAADTLVGDTAASASPLLAADLADRVTVTPHIAAQTTQAVDSMGTMALDDVIAVLSGDAPRWQLPVSHGPTAHGAPAEPAHTAPDKEVTP